MKFLFNFHKIDKLSAVYNAYHRLYSMIAVHANVEMTEKINGSIRSYDYIICANIWQLLLTYFYAFGSSAKIVFWIQGAVAEESYLKNKSKLKFYILKFIELICLYLADAYIFVSPYMKNSYSRINFVKKKSNVVIPCISDLLYDRNQLREKLSFCYLGGMSEWQNFSLIVTIMNKINVRYPMSTFRIATNEVEKCKKIIQQKASDDLIHKIQVVSFSSKSDIASFLSKCEFGFLIRDDIFVNHVSSPIKLAEYLSCGVNVITTNAIKSYSPFLQKAGIILDSLENINDIDFNAETISALELYQKMFSIESVQVAINNFVNELRSINK